MNNTEVTCSDVTRDIRGLCAGDVKGTYVPPAGYKMAEPGLEWVHEGVLAMADEMIFPVRVDRDMEIGAITLLLDFDPSVMLVTDVTNATSVTDKTTVTNVTTVTNNATVTNSPELWFNVLETTLNTLQIGWMSTEPISVSENETVLLIHARLTDAFRRSHFTFSDSHLASGELNVKPKMRNVKCEISFALNENPLSEFADGDGNVIDGLKLSMPVAGKNGETVKGQNGKMVCYPNPAQEILNIELLTEKDGLVKVDLVNIQGISVFKIPQILVNAGWNREKINVSGMAPGVYLLKVISGDVTEIRKVIVRR